MHLDLTLHFDDKSGDGLGLKFLPGPLRVGARNLSNKLRSIREKRILRIAAAIYPKLQALEAAGVSGDNQVLAGMPFAKAIMDARAIERGLTLFEVAWQAKLAKVKAKPGGKPLAYGDKKTVLTACGMSLLSVEQYFVHRAMSFYFVDNPKALPKLKQYATDRTILPRMRLLASTDVLAIDEFQQGLGPRFAEIFTKHDVDYIDALRHYKAYQARSLRKVLNTEFRQILDWHPEKLKAMAVGFQCVEQFTDLGEFLGELRTPEMIAAFAAWEKRDITDKVNEERKKDGQRKLKGRRFETDIGFARKIIGGAFVSMCEGDDPRLIAAFGELIKEVRLAEGHDKQFLIEALQAFVKRYFSVMTYPMMVALTLAERDVDKPHLTFAEANSVLEGLWMKNGLGSIFFEGPFKTEAAAKCVRGLVLDYLDMKVAGRVKQGTDLMTIITTSDLFDRHVTPLIRMKQQAQAQQQRAGAI